MQSFSAIGDRAIGIFAPSSPFEAARFEAGLDVLRKLGFPTVVHPQAHARQGYLAGSDDARRQALLDLLADPAVGAVMAARGGYGVARWADSLEANSLTADKPVVGFSDVTALHSVLQSRGARQSIHGPVVTQLPGLPEADAQALAALLRDPTTTATLAAAGPALAPGRATGPLVGGCLSIVTAAAGTPLLHVPEGAILLLEEVQEAPYRLDRMLTQLHLAGVLDRVAGVALGDFVQCAKQRPTDPEAIEVLAERLGARGVPVLAGLPIGHGARNHPVVLGRTATLDSDAGTLELG